MFRNRTRKNKQSKARMYTGGSDEEDKKYTGTPRPKSSDTLKLKNKNKSKNKYSYSVSFLPGTAPSLSVLRGLFPSKIHINKPQSPAIKAAIKKAEKVIDESDVFGKFNKSVRNSSARRITSAIRGIFLKKMCIDSNVCMGFGKHRKKIIDYFKGFTTFEYAVEPIKMIGSPSANGFIIEIPYNRHKGLGKGYTAYTVLKSAKEAYSDNLAYEYIVGKFINEQCDRYPCFIQTYGLYYYTDEDAWDFFQDKRSQITKAELKNDLQLHPTNDYNFAKMCSESNRAAILVEHLKNASPLQSMITIGDIATRINFIIEKLVYVLYQIYMPLAQLQDVFTHYDLHCGNILLYEPIKGKHIKYHYHLPDGSIVSFNSPYIVKIIDYGRSFYNYGDRSTRNPENIYSNLCETNECTIVDSGKEYDCGSAFGLAWLKPKFNQNQYFISSSMSNPSHDLRLLKQTYQVIEAMRTKSTIMSIKQKGPRDMFLSLYETIAIDLFDKVKYGIGIFNPQNKEFGSEPNADTGYPYEINNVKDAEKSIRDIIMMPEFIDINNIVHKDANKIGDMHIYSDGKAMEFIPV